MISENQGLEKPTSVSNLRKFSGPANMDILLGLNPGDKLKKKSRFHQKVEKASNIPIWVQQVGDNF